MVVLYSLRRKGRVLPSLSHQLPVKSKPENVACCLISALVLPVPPPALVVLPEVSVSQKELVTVPPPAYPTSPPAKLLPLTLPVL